MKIALTVGAGRVYCHGEATAEERGVEAAVARALDARGAALKVCARLALSPVAQHTLASFCVPAPRRTCPLVAPITCHLCLCICVIITGAVGLHALVTRIPGPPGCTCPHVLHPSPAKNNTGAVGLHAVPPSPLTSVISRCNRCCGAPPCSTRTTCLSGSRTCP